MPNALEREWVYLIKRARKSGKNTEAEKLRKAQMAQEERLTAPDLTPPTTLE